MPKVSVVIPAYNVEAYIAHSLRSVLNQTFDDFEVLVVDDGSSDGTVEIVEGFDDRRIHIVRQANRGLAGARNGGIRVARGDYIAFLDADDLWHPEKLARHVEHLEQAREVGVSYSQSAFIDEAGKPLGYLQTPKLRNVRARDVFLRNPVGNGSAPVVRRAALRDIAYKSPKGTPEEHWYFDEDFRQSEDIECWTRIALTTTWRFEGIGMPLTYYRVNAGGLSANLDKQLLSWECMVARVARYAPFFVARWSRASRGYQLRYLARRALRMGDPTRALQLLAKALREHPAMLLEEPARTVTTVAAAALRGLLPDRLYRWTESRAMRIASQRMQ